jgi:hypothetical protein
MVLLRMFSSLLPPMAHQTHEPMPVASEDCSVAFETVATVTTAVGFTLARLFGNLQHYNVRMHQQRWFAVVLQHQHAIRMPNTNRLLRI